MVVTSLWMSSYPLNVCVRLSKSSSLTLFKAEKHVLNFLKRKKAIVGDYLLPNPNTAEEGYIDTIAHDILLLSKRNLLEGRGVDSYTQFVDQYSSSLNDKQRLYIPSADKYPENLTHLLSAEVYNLSRGVFPHMTASVVVRVDYPEDDCTEKAKKRLCELFSIGRKGKYPPSFFSEIISAKAEMPRFPVVMYFVTQNKTLNLITNTNPGPMYRDFAAELIENNTYSIQI